MVFTQSARSALLGRRTSSFASLVATLSVLTLLPTAAMAQRAGDLDGSGTNPDSGLGNVEVLSPSIAQGGLFSIAGGKRLMSEAQTAYSSQNYDVAANKLQDARQIMNQLSTFYSTLTSSFLGVDRRVSESHRKKALETAQLRDKATFELALVYRAQNKPDKSIPLLIEIIRSQNPSRELGEKSYQQLVELGFSDVPYSSKGSSTPAPAPAPTPAPAAPTPPLAPPTP